MNFPFIFDTFNSHIHGIFLQQCCRRHQVYSSTRSPLCCLVSHPPLQSPFLSLALPILRRHLVTYIFHFLSSFCNSTSNVLHQLSPCPVAPPLPAACPPLLRRRQEQLSAGTRSRAFPGIRSRSGLNSWLATEKKSL